MGVPSGGSLGAAQGSITINVSQLATAQAAVRTAAQGINQAMAQISPQAQRAQSSITQLSSALQQLGSVFGVTFGAAGVAQLARFVGEIDAVATAYRRQSIAAVNLAGGQQQLNDLMITYQRATGGVLDQATALTNVTQLMAVGFADSSEELDRFARAIRGISIAMGRPQEFVTQNLILESFSQRGMRLDQLGLDYEKVRRAADQLAASDRNLTAQQAYQNAILDQAIERYGALAASVEGQTTGLELLARAWKEARREMGEAISPVTNLFGTLAATAVILEVGKLRAWAGAINDVIDAWKELLRTLGIAPAATTQTGTPATPTAAAPSLTQDQTDTIRDWWMETREIERQANRDRLEATRQYEQQRTDTIRQYEKTIAREAEDFALARARSQEDYALNLQRTWRDIAQREQRQRIELERNIAEARSDASERASERQVALEEQLAEARTVSRERTAEMEAEFNKRRERALRDHQEDLMDAAANLDANAVYRQQRDFARRQRDEQEDFAERIGKERSNEEKRLAELGKAHAKQTADEQKALEKRIRQAEEAYTRQLEDGRAADSQRLEDMAADFALRQQREDEDRANRLERLRQDHDEQLAEQARQHLARIVQINEQEAEEIRLANEAFDEQMAALDVFHAGYLERQQAFQTRSLVAYQEYLNAQAAELARRVATQGPQPINPYVAPGQFPRLTTPAYTPPQRSPTGEGYLYAPLYPGNGSSVSNSNTFNIYQQPGQSARDLADEIAVILEGMNP